MQKTIYVKDEDVPVFVRAEELGGKDNSLSSIITESLKRWVESKGQAAKLDAVAEQAVAYLDDVEETTPEAIGEAIGEDPDLVSKALKRANRKARQHIAAALRGNWWFDDTYPVQAEGWGREAWTLEFRSSADKDEDEDG